MIAEAGDKSAKPAPGKYTKPQEDARRYVEQHSLERFLAQILNGVVQARPAKPRVWMIKFLAERCSPQELQEAGISVKGLHKSQVTRSASPRQLDVLDPEADGRRDSLKSGADTAGASASPAKAGAEQPTEAPEVCVSSGRKATRLTQDDGDGERPQELNRTISQESEFKPPERDDQVKKAEQPEKELGSVDRGKAMVQISDPEETRTAWREVRNWEELREKLESGLPLPTATTEGFEHPGGGPRWLADHLAKEPEEAVSRLRELSDTRGSFLYAADADGHNLAMALAERMGEGPWIDYITDRGICTRSAQDQSGKTVGDYARKFAGESGGVGSSQPRADPKAVAESARESVAGAILQTPDRRVVDEAGRELEKPASGPMLVTEAQLRAAFDVADVDGVLFLNQKVAEELRVSLGLPKRAFGDPEGWQDERISLDEMLAALRERELLVERESMASEGTSQPTPQTAEADYDDEGC